VIQEFFYFYFAYRNKKLSTGMPWIEVKAKRKKCVVHCLVD
jgi:hypothetical protein